MARYLTPARICLLVLVRAYQAGQSSSSSTLPVLAFIARQIVPASPADDSTEAATTTARERSALASPDITCLAEQLRQWASCHVGRSVWEVVLFLLWKQHSLDSLALLVDHQDPAASGIHPRSLTPSSPLGQFVRRCHIEFTRLHFDEAQALWNAFAAYREPTRSEWLRKNPDGARQLLLVQHAAAVPVSVPAPGSRPDPNASASVVDADALLGFAIHHLQKMGTRVPDEIRSRLERWIGDQWASNTQSLHFFMAFFEHWRSGQYTMALESLHRYFDYSLAARGEKDNLKVYYQYALLHLSVLHADFECWDESVDAMNECIATARENQDPACLSFALSWLLYLRHAHPGQGNSSFGTVAGLIGSGGGGEHDEIAFLKQKAKDGKHWMLLSSTLLEEAKLELYSGGSANRAQEYVLQACYLNIQHDLRTLIPAATLFQAASFDRIGQAHLADRLYELPNVVHPSHCPVYDRVRATCRLAHKMARSGSFSHAIDLLQDLSPLVQGVLKLDLRIKAFLMLVQLRRQLHRDDMEAAEYYLNQLKPIRDGSDPELVLEIDLLEIELLIRQSRHEEALERVAERFKELKGRGSDIAQRTHYLILKSRIFAAGGQASKGFAVALRACSIAERHQLLPVLFEGLAVLSQILLDLLEFEMTKDLLEATLPHAIEFSHAELTARMYVTAGEACVGLAGHRCENGSNEQARHMRKAQELIEHGRIAYEKCEDLQGMLTCLIMKSRIASWSGDETSAALADEMYYQLLTDKQEALASE